MKHLIIFPAVMLLCMNYTSLEASEENAAVNEALKSAAPFKHTVKITRSGRILKMNYEIIGKDGKKYDIRKLLNYNYKIKPSVAIYKGDLQVASGSFEYG